MINIIYIIDIIIVIIIIYIYLIYTSMIIKFNNRNYCGICGWYKIIMNFFIVIMTNINIIVIIVMIIFDNRMIIKTHNITLRIIFLILL